MMRNGIKSVDWHLDRSGCQKNHR